MRRTTVRADLLVAILLMLLAAAPVALAVTNGRIAYTDVVPNDPNHQRAIFVDPGGQLTHPAVGESDWAPAWSPDGRTLAFARYSNLTGQHSIMKANADGSNVRVHLASVNQNGNHTQLYGKGVSQLVWSPDGNLLAAILVETSVIGGTPFLVSLPYFFGYSFDWGLSGTVYPCLNLLPQSDHQLFCVRDRNGVVHFTGTDETDVGAAGAVSWKTRFSPQGRRVVFEAGSLFSIEPNFDDVPGNVYGTDLRRLTPDPGTISCTDTFNGFPVTRTAVTTTYGAPVPSPDGKYIAVLRNEYEYRLDATIDFCLLKQIPSIVFLREDGVLQRIVSTSETARALAWQPSPANVTVVIDDGHDHELQGLVVNLRDLDTGDVIASPVNSAGGTYQFENVPPGDYHVRATLWDDENRFDIRHEGTSAEALWAEWSLHVDDAENIERHVSFVDSQVIDTNGGDPGNFFLWERLDDMAVIYYQTRRFVDWVKANLTTNTGEKVAFHTFATSSPFRAVGAREAFYANDAVYMGTQLSEYESRDESTDAAPVNGEWHEYSHHLDKNQRGAGAVACPGESSHHGYRNGSTCDSFGEGVASFLPAMFTGDPDYAGITNHEFQTKAWSFRISDDPLQGNMEDFAVAALLWDLVDDDADSEYTLAVGANGLHVPVTYTDGVNLSLRSLWELFGSAHPDNIHNLKLALDSVADGLSIDFDLDGLNDVNFFDPVFLMHGFFPITFDQFVSGTHRTYHYDIARARQAGLTANFDVGKTNHDGFTWGLYTSPAWNLRFNTLASDVANLDIQVRDASGTALEGVDFTITIHYPGFDQPVRRHLGSGENHLVHLELPLYFDHIPTDETGALPACDPATDLNVGVTLSASINGYVSGDLPSFDNCTYVQAMVAASGPAALAYTMTFPEDSTAPVTTLESFASGPVFGSSTSGEWTVELACDDPVVGDFASGCTRSEYRIDGGAVVRYTDPVTLADVGPHLFEYRSLDAAANEEAFRSVALEVLAGPPADLAVSQVEGADPIFLGSALTYTVNVTNSGPNTGSVNLRDSVGYPTFSAFPSQGSCSPSVGGLVNCALGTIATGAGASVVVTFVPFTPGSYTNSAEVSLSLGADPTPANNLSTETTTVLPRRPGDRVWADGDGDGVQDPAESGVPDVVVGLYDDADNLLDGTLTDASGNYAFPPQNLGATYRLKFIPPSGYALTVKDQGGDDALDSDADPVTQLTPAFVFGDFQDPFRWDAGLVVSCVPPDAPIFIFTVTKDADLYPILHFQDGNQPSQVTGYNVYRSSNSSLAYPSWPRVATSYVDMATPNKQWVDNSGAVPPGGIWYYLVTAYNELCAAEGPF